MTKIDTSGSALPCKEKQLLIIRTKHLLMWEYFLYAPI